ncbi:MAG: acyl carrier protein [Thaumarchaeota archaeon]|jgi:acyl carrier protein|nr:acyl carrier protein [Nitrososphaerota archaeon]
MSVEEKVKKIIAEHFRVSVESLKDDTSLVDDLMAESIDTVELIAAFEEAFNLEIPEEEAEKNQTVGQVVEYIKRKLAQAGC